MRRCIDPHLAFIRRLQQHFEALSEISFRAKLLCPAIGTVTLESVPFDACVANSNPTPKTEGPLL
jgi:hypothetical protein